MTTRKSKILCFVLAIVFVFVGCAWAAVPVKGTLCVKDKSGNLHHKECRVENNTSVEFVVSWDADFRELINCVAFFQSGDSTCLFDCQSKDQSADHGWHHGEQGNGHHGHEHNNSCYGSEWHHNHAISHHTFNNDNVSGDCEYYIIAKGYSGATPVGEPVAETNILGIKVASASTSGNDNPGNSNDSNNSNNGNNSNTSGGGGCMAGFMGLTLLLVVPMFMKRS